MSRLALVAFCTSTGLGYQTRLYHKYLKPSKTMVVDISRFNGMKLNPDWYPDAWRFVRGFPTDQDYDDFLQDVDTVLLAETPLNYRLFKRARELGVKTCLVVNPEFCDYLNRPDLPRPDVLALPSEWMRADIERIAAGAQVTSLPVPLDLAKLPQRTIMQARHFFHVAGRPAIHDRNGTLDFIAAAKVANIRMPEATFTLYCQQPTPDIQRALHGSRVQLVGHVEDQADIYRQGDVMVMPRRYGGQSLPVSEALGCGIPVLMPDISPNNTWLPRSWLVPALPGQKRFMARCPINVYSVNITMLAQRMVDLYRDSETVVAGSQHAKAIAQGMTWTALKPRYEEVLSASEVTV